MRCARAVTSLLLSVNREAPDVDLTAVERRRFWSVTVYRESDLLFFGDLPYDKATNIFRYNINQDTPGFDFNDGTFTIYLSTTPPPRGTRVYSNWLPIGKKPDSKFGLYLRLYGPDEAAQSSRYSPPILVAHKGTWGQPAPSNLAEPLLF